MINTDKYEGHTEGPWKALLNHPQVEGSCVVSGEDESNFGDELGPLWVGELTDDMPDAKLIADAPLLLAEVKRLYELHTLIGVPIPWKVDYGDGGGYETFVADAVEWNYDDSGEWGLVNYNETRWMTLETAKEWMDKEMRE